MATIRREAFRWRPGVPGLLLGLTPGYIGLGQANFVLPDLAPGDYPLTIVIGTEVSNGPVITIGPR